MTGCGNKKRFSLKLMDDSVLRFGSCDPRDDDGRDIKPDENGMLWLVGGKTSKNVEPKLIQLATTWTNGYYDYEHDGWKPMSEWK